MRKVQLMILSFAVIAVGLLGFIAAQSGQYLGEAQASEMPTPALEQGPSSQEGYPPPGGELGDLAATSTLPLRWRVRHVILEDSTASVDCFPVVSVRNLAGTSTSVDVEWFDHGFNSKKLSSATISAGSVMNFGVYSSGGNDGTSNSLPFVITYWPSVTDDFRGSAQVHADDPRISVAAFLRCDDQPADQLPTIITDLPCDPVGATMEFFQAGMPSTWPPARLADPEEDLPR